MKYILLLKMILVEVNYKIQAGNDQVPKTTLPSSSSTMFPSSILMFILGLSSYFNLVLSTH